MRLVTEMLDENLGDPTGVDELAKACDLPIGVFRRAFFKSFGNVSASMVDEAPPRSRLSAFAAHGTSIVAHCRALRLCQRSALGARLE
jgi:hypothetical protein